MDHSMKTHSTSPLHRLFIIVRNCRVSFASSNSAVNQRTGQVNLFCSDALSLLRQVVMNKQDKNRLVAKISVAIKTFKPAATILTKRLAAVIALDDLYNWLYYATSLTNGLGLPTPAEYYSIYAFDPTQESLQSYWTRFGSDEMKAGDETNPLLELFRSRFLETFAIFGEEGLKVIAKDCLPSGEGTSLKDSDPLCPSLLNSWRDSVRIFACYVYAFAVPNEAALKVIEQYSPIIEVGAGTGYWASLLRARKVIKITALDIAPPTTLANEYHGRCGTHTTVDLGSPASLSSYSTACSLFLCYPPPEGK